MIYGVCYGLKPRLHWHGEKALEIEAEAGEPLRCVACVVRAASNGEMKRYNTASGAYLNQLPNIDDKFNLLSAGLWNFR